MSIWCLVTMLGRVVFKRSKWARGCVDAWMCGWKSGLDKISMMSIIKEREKDLRMTFGL